MHGEAEQFLNVDRVGRNSDAFTGLVGALENVEHDYLRGFAAGIAVSRQQDVMLTPPGHTGGPTSPDPPLGRLARASLLDGS